MKKMKQVIFCKTLLKNLQKSYCREQHHQPKGVKAPRRQNLYRQNSCSDFYFCFTFVCHKFRLNWSGTFLEVQLWASESFSLKEKLEKFNVWSRGNNTKHCIGASVSGVSWKCFTFCSDNVSPLNLQTPSAALQQDLKLPLKAAASWVTCDEVGEWSKPKF